MISIFYDHTIKPVHTTRYVQNMVIDRIQHQLKQSFESHDESRCEFLTH